MHREKKYNENRFAVKCFAPTELKDIVSKYE